MTIEFAIWKSSNFASLVTLPVLWQRKLRFCNRYVHTNIWSSSEIWCGKLPFGWHCFPFFFSFLLLLIAALLSSCYILFCARRRKSKTTKTITEVESVSTNATSSTGEPFKRLQFLPRFVPITLTSSSQKSGYPWSTKASDFIFVYWTVIKWTLHL